MTAEMFERVLRVHLYGTFFNTRAAARHMVAQQYGRIINTTSRAGLRGFPPGECNYSAAKMGIVGLTLALAWELSPHRVTVNCVSPVAWTRTAEGLPEAERKAAWQARAKNVLGRTGLPEDAAHSYRFLASDEAAYVTGQVIEATGEPMMLL
jgi:3-oxoacyl-[acyl-carrier protein] reductase